MIYAVIWLVICFNTCPVKLYKIVKHVITFKNPKPPLLNLLRESGPVPGDTTNGVGQKRAADGVPDGQKKKKKSGENSKGLDMDKLAEGLQKLNEDDLLQVVQMVHDHKSDDSWMRNDADGKFDMHFEKQLTRSSR